jgi:biopolymer transport protein ExbD
MGMSLGSGNGPRANINMTPMIDVLLVLIIIFMVIAPTKSRGLKALVPQQSDSGPAPTTESDDVVVTVNGNHTVSINRETVRIEELSGRLQRLFVHHPGHPLFVRGGKTLEFQQVAEVIDIARGVGLERIALMTN